MELEFDTEWGELGADAATERQAAQGSGGSQGIATLFHRFSSALAEPERHTIGAFAETVIALHAELARLAEHFSTVAVRVAGEGSDGHQQAAGDPMAEFEALEASRDRP